MDLKRTMLLRLARRDPKLHPDDPARREAIYNKYQVGACPAPCSGCCCLSAVCCSCLLLVQADDALIALAQCKPVLMLLPLELGVWAEKT